MPHVAACELLDQVKFRVQGPDRRLSYRTATWNARKKGGNTTLGKALARAASSGADTGKSTILSGSTLRSTGGSTDTEAPTANRVVISCAQSWAGRNGNKWEKRNTREVEVGANGRRSYRGLKIRRAYLRVLRALVGVNKQPSWGRRQCRKSRAGGAYSVILHLPWPAHQQTRGKVVATRLFLLLLSSVAKNRRTHVRRARERAETTLG